MRGNLLVADHHVVGLDVGRAGVRADLDADVLQGTLRGGGEVFRILLEDALTTFEQDHAGLAWIEVAEVATDCVAGDLRDRTGQLDAGRTAADDDERQQRLTLRGVRFALGAFEGEENAAPHLERVGE